MDVLHQQLILPSPPAPVSGWPPAPGWWIVLGSLLILGLLLPLMMRRLHRRRTYRLRQRLQVFAELPATLPDSLWLAEINIRLKQLLRQRGEDAATRLFGDAWLDYLCSRCPAARREALQPLAEDLYRPGSQLNAAQRQALLKELNLWLGHAHV